MQTAVASARRAKPDSHAPKEYRWSREIVGGRPVYTIYGRELNKPHRFKNEVYDAARCRRILRDTQRRLPVGKVIVGHNSGREGFRVGALTNYRERGVVTLGDLQHIEPEAFLAVALGRLDHTSVEFEWPSLEVIESVALLGSSRQFFDDFPPLRVRLNPEQWAQLRRDASEWPLPWRSRPKRPHSQGRTPMPATPKAAQRQSHHDDEDAEMEEAAAEAALDGSGDGSDEDAEMDDIGHRAMDEAGSGEGSDAGGAGDAAATARADFDAQLAESPLIRELMARIAALEDANGAQAEPPPSNAPQGEPVAADQGRSRTGPKPASGKRSNEARDPHALRLSKLEREVAEGRWRGKLDAMRSRGTAVSAEQEREILDAVLAKRSETDREKAFRALTTGLPKAPLHDDDDAGATRTKGKPGDALRSVLERFPEATRQRIRANLPKYEAEAKELGRSLPDYLAAQNENVF